MDDLISRQALCEYALNQKDKSITPNDIMRFLSAQPDSKELSSTHKALDTISRQAAIRWVKTECNPYGKPTLDFESGKKVIEHLKQMPSAQPETHEERTETHSCDCIERQAAIDAHYEYCNKHPDAGFPVWSLKILEDLPSAQPERQKGKWIDDEGNTVTDKYCAICSACGEWSEYLTAYCPNCGAEMTEGEG